MQMVMTSDETQIQIFANWPMSHAKRVTRDNRKNPEYRVVAAIRKLRTDKNCPAGKSWPNHVKNEQEHIGFQFGLYRVVAPLSFLRSVSLASLFTCLFIFD